MTTTSTPVVLPTASLQDAYDGSYYFIAGAGGDLTAWVTGYGDLLAERGIGKPVAWFQTTGEAVNAFAGEGVGHDDQFPSDLTCLLFPLTDLKVGTLAMFKLQMQDRWFDDVIDNMRPDPGYYDADEEES